ncbi:accessory factor UbiK family protein [Candidatus Vallotia cooleyia]|uniref:accessory factor UbiK family protein n=1 Tax=Candidatus Vallotiella adelgis TaxID=1177211 RepID=UPI001D013D40|nr:accessory factor UbiK family protein [Candidatus Vallotia cooleyia]
MKQRNSTLNDLKAYLREVLKNSLAKDVERNVKTILLQGLSRLDLVTREEFNTQSQILSRTRLRLEALERRVDQL